MIPNDNSSFIRKAIEDVQMDLLVGAGLTVLIWHGAGIYSAYFHLSRAEVKAGQRVARGEPIGRSGASGRATGPHLHWGLKAGDRWVDPESILRLVELRR